MPLIYAHPDCKATIELNYVRKWSEHNYMPLVRVFTVYAKSGDVLKTVDYLNPLMGKGKAAQIKEQAKEIRQWLDAYWYHARYPSPIECNSVCGSIGNPQPCPLLRAGNDGRAKCAVAPCWEGHSFSNAGARDVPASLACDLSLETMRRVDTSIPGYPLSLYDLRECNLGIALAELTREAAADE